MVSYLRGLLGKFQLPKQRATGSIPVARSNNRRGFIQMVVE